jgi:hypothetical protein|tara:strand:- start:3460 stop:3732 length:273 start_codon:yes stop_codon:yes gene_type:complete
MKAKAIVINWLDSLEDGEVFYSHNFETQVPYYGKVKYDRIHTASTYSRVFRMLRANNALLEACGIRLEEVKHNTNGRVKGWKKIADSTAN